MSNVGPFYLPIVNVLFNIVAFTLPGIREDGNKLPSVDSADRPTLHVFWCYFKDDLSSEESTPVPVSKLDMLKLVINQFDCFGWYHWHLSVSGTNRYLLDWTWIVRNEKPLVFRVIVLYSVDVITLDLIWGRSFKKWFVFISYPRWRHRAVFYCVVCAGIIERTDTIISGQRQHLFL